MDCTEIFSHFFLTFWIWFLRSKKFFFTYSSKYLYKQMALAGLLMNRHDSMGQNQRRCSTYAMWSRELMRGVARGRRGFGKWKAFRYSFSFFIVVPSAINIEWRSQNCTARGMSHTFGQGLNLVYEFWIFLYLKDSLNVISCYLVVIF